MFTEHSHPSIKDNLSRERERERERDGKVIQRLNSRIRGTLLRSSAVISMKTFFVLRVILVWSPLMIVGMERTTLFLSKIMG